MFYDYCFNYMISMFNKAIAMGYTNQYESITQATKELNIFYYSISIFTFYFFIKCCITFWKYKRYDYFVWLFITSIFFPVISTILFLFARSNLIKKYVISYDLFKEEQEKLKKSNKEKLNDIHNKVFS